MSKEPKELNDLGVATRKHIKTYQSDQYKVADKRIKEAAQWGFAYLITKHNQAEMRMVNGFKRFSWL